MVMSEDDVVGQPGGGNESESAHNEPGPDEPGIVFRLEDDIRQETDETGGDHPENPENGLDKSGHC